MLRRVADLPKVDRSRCGKESYVAKDVREFARNKTYDVAEVYYEGKRAKSVVDSLKQYIKRHPDVCKGITAALRNGKAYLIREVKR